MNASEIGFRRRDAISCQTLQGRHSWNAEVDFVNRAGLRALGGNLYTSTPDLDAFGTQS